MLKADADGSDSDLAHLAKDRITTFNYNAGTCRFEQRIPIISQASVLEFSHALVDEHNMSLTEAKYSTSRVNFRRKSETFGFYTCIQRK